MTDYLDIDVWSMHHNWGQRVARLEHLAQQYDIRLVPQTVQRGWFRTSATYKAYGDRLEEFQIALARVWT